ncbi:MAG: hypothetical protein LBF91_01525 [Azoarcus sp.]|nr:hypothetical protein [Azoarcus sp.]
MALKDLLFRETNQDNPPAPADPSEPNKTAPETVQHSPVSGNADDMSDLAKKLVEDFKRIVNQNNLPGIDILEFSKALFKKGSNPSADDYQRIFDVLHAVDDKLTTQQLIESSSTYKKMILDLAGQDITKGNSRKSEVEKAKTAEEQALDKEQRSLNDEIAKLEAQLQGKRDRLAQIALSLKDVDRKFQADLDDIVRKISAIEQASQQVILSFDDVEHGIRTYLN